MIRFMTFLFLLFPLTLSAGGLYGTVGFGQTFTINDGIDETGAAIGGGLQLLDIGPGGLGIEGEWQRTGDADFGLLAAALKLPLTSSFRLTGRVGVDYQNIEGAIDQRSVKGIDWNVVAGAGAEYDLTDQFFVYGRADFRNVTLDGGWGARAADAFWSAGVGMRLF